MFKTWKKSAIFLLNFLPEKCLYIYIPPGKFENWKQKQIFEGFCSFLLLLKYLYKYIRPKFSGALRSRNFEVYRFATMNNRNVQGRFGIRKHPEFLKNRVFFSSFWHSSPIVREIFPVYLPLCLWWFISVLCYVLFP